MSEFVTFGINDQTVGVDTLNVERIIKLSNISPIYNSPNYLEGVIDIQNSLIPIINLKKAFNLSSKDILPGSSVIIVSYESKMVGIIADFVNDIIQINDDAILKTRDNKYVYGVAKVENTFINLLNSNSFILD